MRKNAPKLVIHRETLRNLDRAALTGGRAATVSNDVQCLSVIGGCPTMGIYSCGCEPTVGLDDCVQLVTDTNCAC